MRKRLWRILDQALYDIMAGDDRYERLVEDIIDSPSFLSAGYRLVVCGMIIKESW